MKSIYPSASRTSLLPPLLSSGALKWIALVTMLIDHIGAVILEKGVIAAYNLQLPTAASYETSLLVSQIDSILRKIGRISFPIFCFLLVEGFFHTSSKKKYAARLFFFALLTEVPFDLAFRGSFLEASYQNVLFTLLFGFLTIWAMDRCRQKHPLLAVFPAALGILAGYFFHADYDWKGIVLILLLYFFYYDPLEKTIAGCVALLWEPFACLAFFPINLYNQQKGKSLKYFFYLFYPLHLLILFLIRYCLFGI